MSQNYCVPECKKEVYVENGVKISFHTFPEEKKVIYEMDRRYSKTFPSDKAHEFARDISSHRIIFLHLRGVKGL